MGGWWYWGDFLWLKIRTFLGSRKLDGDYGEFRVKVGLGFVLWEDFWKKNWCILNKWVEFRDK